MAVLNELKVNISMAWWVMPSMHVFSLCNRISGWPTLEQATDIAMRGVKFRMEAKG